MIGDRYDQCPMIGDAATGTDVGRRRQQQQQPQAVFPGRRPRRQQQGGTRGGRERNAEWRAERGSRNFWRAGRVGRTGPSRGAVAIASRGPSPFGAKLPLGGGGKGEGEGEDTAAGGDAGAPGTPRTMSVEKRAPCPRRRPRHPGRFNDTGAVRSCLGGPRDAAPRALRRVPAVHPRWHGQSGSARVSAMHASIMHHASCIRALARSPSAPSAPAGRHAALPLHVSASGARRPRPSRGCSFGRRTCGVDRAYRWPDDAEPDRTRGWSPWARPLPPLPPMDVRPSPPRTSPVTRCPRPSHRSLPVRSLSRMTKLLSPALRCTAPAMHARLRPAIRPTAPRALQFFQVAYFLRAAQNPPPPPGHPPAAYLHPTSPPPTAHHPTTPPPPPPSPSPLFFAFLSPPTPPYGRCPSSQPSAPRPYHVAPRTPETLQPVFQASSGR